ncbi:MAG: nucleotidyltransferase family protein [Planctomycetaceae bacterium]|nr:nucleotidyltransferase family protein [Planctomycetaceae bacterium]MBV8610210.1 nucleotidyltransferase family protein [Singulisphaera sp.]MBV8231499.1 nucleotidyltransferase family protein [Planctomycetaceae bacterium]MBV8266565.1 nucleotidyltransferase family protein [Planctomycetaceae bacterium]MBV8317538.1 nucleotidyltransferase family protein [Planctomycetaceae bacterium]
MSSSAYSSSVQQHAGSAQLPSAVLTDYRGMGYGLSDITTAILVGGLGTRLRTVVSDRPKALASVQGRPFLAFLLDQLVEARVRDVVLCVGYKAEQVREVFGAEYKTLRLAYSSDPEPMGTAGALRIAIRLFTSSPVLVMNGDSYCDTDLNAFRAWHDARRSSASLLLTSVPETARYGRVQIDELGHVTCFEEKGGVAGPGRINAGIYLIDRDLLQSIPAGRPVSLEREVFPGWIGRNLYGFSSPGRFLDIGTPESYALTDGFFGGVGSA